MDNINQGQMMADKFYMENGKCCAGCDYWETDSMAIIGECKNSKIISAKERADLLEIKDLTLDLGAGHALTERHYVCGQFKDDFNWESLSPFYLKRIGYYTRKN